MKKVIKYILLFFLITAVLKNCGSKKADKKLAEDKTPAKTSENISISINYKKQKQLNKDNVFGLNTGFVWNREIDKEKDFVALLNESNNVVLRFPGGGVANNYYPDEVGYGYNPTKRPISKIGIMLHKQTKDRKYNIIENFISLCKQTNAKAIYCANLLDGTPEKMLMVIDRLKQENIEVLGVEMGNEFNLGNFRHLFPTGQVYLDTIKSYVAAIRKNYPDLPIGLIAEGLHLDELNNKRNQFMHEWNKTLSSVDFDAYIVHTYFPIDVKQQQFDDIYLKSKEISNPYHKNYTKKLLEYFNSLENGKSKKIWITEWGIFNPYAGNTFFQAAFVGQFLNNIIEYDTENTINIACLHDIGAMIGHMQSKQHKYTYQPNNYFAGSIFFPYKFLADIVVKHQANMVEHQLKQEKNADILIKTFYSKADKKTFIYFINTNNTTIHFNIEDAKIPIKTEYIQSQTLYGNIGTAAFLKEHPDKNYLIEYKTESTKTSTIEIQPYSLGVISF